MRRHRAGAVITGLLLLAACGEQEGAGTAPVETNRIEMPRHYRFEPADVRVPQGTSVTWHNSDDFTHSVEVRIGDGEPEFRRIAPGDSASIVFPSPGEYAYVCTYHPHQMSGTVVVVPDAPATPGSAAGG